MKCVHCGAEVQGKFCVECGQPAGGSKCPDCGAKTKPGGGFCTQCGAAIGASGSGRGSDRSKLGWWVAGALFLVLIVVTALPVLRQGGGDPPSFQPAAAPTGSGAVDLSSMNPREIADRLFNRVMSSAEAGDSAAVERFLPKAITAHEMARPLDADGLYHLALLHETSGDYQAALAAAREVLDDEPDHLLNLSAAAKAAAQLGDAHAAAVYYEHLLKVFNAEIAADRAEYRIHSTMISRLRSEAEAFLGQR